MARRMANPAGKPAARNSCQELSSNAGAGGAHHFEIVGTVSDGDDLRFINAEFGAYPVKPVSFALCVDDITQHRSGELSIDDFKGVGVRVVQIQAIFKAVGEEGKPA